MKIGNTTILKITVPRDCT